MFLLQMIIATLLLVLTAGAALGQPGRVAATRVSAPCEQGVAYMPAHKKPHAGPAWLDQLSTDQRQQAERILTDARPRLQELRQQLRLKMSEIKTFVYGRGTDPDVLPRLGQELQALRNALYAELRTLETRLADEAGVPARGQSGRGCSELARPDSGH